MQAGLSPGAPVGLLHPGEMGAALGGALRARGTSVLWASAGRSEQTGRRAKQAGLDDAGTVAALAAGSGVILSVCPPHAAVDVARSVAGHGFGGLFVDANAVAPATSRSISGTIRAAGGRYVDGGIIGPPPRPGNATRLYLSGAHAHEVVDVFRGTGVDARVVSGEVGAASALKMAYAAWTKGTAALLLASRALARAEGVEPALVQEWSESLPTLADRSRGAAGSAAAKGWRWVAEMEEIAATFALAGLPDGFHLAAGEIFRRAPRLDAAGADDATLDRVVAALLAAGRGEE